MPCLHVLALDPAKSTGYARCMVSEDRTECRVVDYGVLTTTTETSTHDDFSTVGRTCNALYDKVEELLHPMPDVCYIEDFFVSSKALRGVGLNYYLRGAICMLLSKKAVKYKFLSPTEWKAFVTGHRDGRPTKVMKETYGRSANKAIVVEKLRERYGLTLPDRIHIDGKLRKCPSDVSDAIGIALYGMHTDYPNTRL
eukprot:1639647-Pleurochrysis_carterae.AAC.1